MRGTIAIIVIAVLGFFGYQYGVNGRTPADVFAGTDDVAADAGDAVTDAASGVEETLDEVAEEGAQEAREAEAAMEAAEAEAAADMEAAEAEAERMALQAEAEAAAAAAALEAEAIETVDDAATTLGEMPDAIDDPIVDEASEIDAATDPAEAEAIDTVTDQTVGDTQDDARAATDDVLESVVEGESAQTAISDVTEQADGMDLDTLLTPDGFDYDRVLIIVDESELSAFQKSALTTGLGQARDNPELLSGILDQIRAAMNVE